MTIKIESVLSEVCIRCEAAADLVKAIKSMRDQKASLEKMASGFVVSAGFAEEQIQQIESEITRCQVEIRRLHKDKCLCMYQDKIV